MRAMRVAIDPDKSLVGVDVPSFHALIAPVSPFPSLGPFNPNDINPGFRPFDHFNS